MTPEHFDERTQRMISISAKKRALMIELRQLVAELGDEGRRWAEAQGITLHHQVEEVAVEAQWTKKVYIDVERTPHEAERREAKLVLDLRDYLQRLGHETKRLKIIPEGELNPVFTDLYDVTLHLIIEAKGSATREAVRMAIGQLADYGRYMPDALRGILVPSRPREDLWDLGESQGIFFMWPYEGRFVTSNINVNAQLRASGDAQRGGGQIQ